VVTTKASPGGCTSIHQSASLDIVCDFETSCDALKALYRFSTTDCAIRCCPDHQNSPNEFVTQPTGSRTHGFSGGSSRSAKACHAKDEVEVKARQSV
jgi:hypothetical protein